MAKNKKNTLTANALGTEITGCAHIVEKGKVPPDGTKSVGNDRVGDQYFDTDERNKFIKNYKLPQPPPNDFVNTDTEFEAWFEKDTAVNIRNNQEIMFYLADENKPNPNVKDGSGTDGWMPYDATFINDNAGLFFILQRKFYDGRFSDPYPSDGFKKRTHKDIITHLGRHNDGTMCILVSMRDAAGIIIDTDGQAGEPEGVGTKIPPPNS
jgi:hypothetical protein